MRLSRASFWIVDELLVRHFTSRHVMSRRVTSENGRACISFVGIASARVMHTRGVTEKFPVSLNATNLK